MVLRYRVKITIDTFMTTKGDVNVEGGGVHQLVDELKYSIPANSVKNIPGVPLVFIK